jgi:hypothetical protein
MTDVNSLDIIVPKIGFSTQIFNNAISVVKDKQFKKAFVRGLVGISLTGVLIFFGGKLKRAIGCQFPENPQNVYKVKQKRTWYQWYKSFITPKTCGKLLGVCTGLILLRIVHNLDFEIKKSAQLKTDLDHARAYIQLLIKSCVEWEDPNK